jgi:hypothetical protein
LSQARASAQSRLTVAGEMLRAGRSVFEAHLREHVAFDDTDLARIQSLEPVQRLVKREKVVDPALGGGDRPVERDVGDAAAPLSARRASA